MQLSDKQIKVLAIVAGKNEDGSLVDLDQIIERQDYKTNKSAIQFIIRNLVQEKKLIEKKGSENRRGRRRVLFDVTPLGEKYAKWTAPKVHHSLKEVLVE